MANTDEDLANMGRIGPMVGLDQWGEEGLGNMDVDWANRGDGPTGGGGVGQQG